MSCSSKVKLWKREECLTFRSMRLVKCQAVTRTACTPCQHQPCPPSPCQQPPCPHPSYQQKPCPPPPTSNHETARPEWQKTAPLTLICAVSFCRQCKLKRVCSWHLLEEKSSTSGTTCQFRHISRSRRRGRREAKQYLHLRLRSRSSAQLRSKMTDTADPFSKQRLNTTDA